jgi:hypothetical protein
MLDERRALRRDEIIGEVVSPMPATEADCFCGRHRAGGSITKPGQFYRTKKGTR